MRPVDRGQVPLNKKTKEPLKFRRYTNARNYLVERMGSYCSYCEVYIRSGIAVEHLAPKVINPDHLTEWDNFLLSCGNCNSTKGKKVVEIEKLAWPHQDNTFLMLRYIEDGGVTFSELLNDADKNRINDLTNLLQLNRQFMDARQTILDVRWEDRVKTWAVAKRTRALLLQLDNDEMRNHIITVALEKGLWSIWMTVFHDDLDMKRRLIAAFPGTALQCFDDECNAIPRP